MKKHLLALLLVLGLSLASIHSVQAQQLDPRCPDQIFVDQQDFFLTEVVPLDYNDMTIDTCIYSNGEYEVHMPLDDVLSLYSWFGHLRSCDSYVVMPSNEFEFLSGCMVNGELTAIVPVEWPEQIVFSLNWQAYDGEYQLEGDGIFSYPLGVTNWNSENVERVQRQECPEYLALTHEDEFVASLFDATAFPGVCRYSHPEGYEVWLVGNMNEANKEVDARAEDLCVNFDTLTIAIASTREIYPYQCVGEKDYGMPFIVEIE